ncbi:uncharacterized protein BO97DRAFT_417838 [Aspergillus homomorphus CBS 101889]|uniref:Uncharacterized protein n=1 Tax=Aspergillus homomorphus (strain CBS 101889) TaxID=1450537 RepID=A0A395HL63_ASPHC|nr:hypothetical protein BO97DRAFT_417838 [Aspergillus homomorphus CBS 101889]RAL08219.1 hypothetical protein BO97DRAFT_417838 [Aspergillus homomorphus CBS 101889]
MSEYVDLRGVDRVLLLSFLYAFAVAEGDERTARWEFDEVEALEAVKGPITRFCGQLIDCDISGGYACPALYNGHYARHHESDTASFTKFNTKPFEWMVEFARGVMEAGYGGKPPPYSGPPEEFDIKGLDKPTLLGVLYAFATAPLLERTFFDEAKAIEAVKGPIEIFCGQAILCDISGDTVDPRRFNLLPYSRPTSFRTVLWVYHELTTKLYPRWNQSRYPFPPLPEVEEVDIAGVDKILLLQTLWYSYIPTIMDKFDEDRAVEAVKGPIDYFCGRPIKCDISGSMASPAGYDQYTQTGAFEAHVQAIRAGASHTWLWIDLWRDENDLKCERLNEIKAGMAAERPERFSYVRGDPSLTAGQGGETMAARESSVLPHEDEDWMMVANGVKPSNP